MFRSGIRTNRGLFNSPNNLQGERINHFSKDNMLAIQPITFSASYEELTTISIQS